jgi:hypothetical protein
LWHALLFAVDLGGQRIAGCVWIGGPGIVRRIERSIARRFGSGLRRVDINEDQGHFLLGGTQLSQADLVEIDRFRSEKPDIPDASPVSGLDRQAKQRMK